MQRALAQSLLWVRGYTLQELQQQANWCRVQRPAEQGWMEGGPYYYQAGDPRGCTGQGTARPLCAG
jgi:hypothetical protein